MTIAGDHNGGQTALALREQTFRVALLIGAIIRRSTAVCVWMLEQTR